MQLPVAAYSNLDTFKELIYSNQKSWTKPNSLKPIEQSNTKDNEQDQKQVNLCQQDLSNNCTPKLNKTQTKPNKSKVGPC